MTLTQLEYVVALDRFRHFSEAAAHCFVTQPTLSMQIQKLEEELGVMLFDRTKQPVVPTETGSEIILIARRLLLEKENIKELIERKKGIQSGELRIGVIPTIAPYLIPQFMKKFASKYPQVKIYVQELITDDIIGGLREGRLDAGLLVTPLNEAGIKEQVLFYEELLVFVSRHNEMFKKEYVLAKDINPDKLWLLEEGHCFRSQIVNLCELQKESKINSQFEYEASSIETLRRMVLLNDGITIIPELATVDLSTDQQKMIRHFKGVAPMREVSMVVHRDFVKKKLVEIVKAELLNAIPEKILKNKARNIVPL